ncbi:MAG TPA: phosphonate C-P lyase system protein PhnL [Candidatus Cybelea sp.]|nr:phosphonate C-P lyase system protein PhnL [Candidatus Cybelea sp.]
MTMPSTTPLLEAKGVSKSFTLHARDRLRLAVLSEIDLAVRPGECVVLDGPSGAGKSTLMRTLYGNYRADGGAILVQRDGETRDLVRATPREILALRRDTIGYISQFLRVIPRVPTIEIVAEPLTALGIDREEARKRAASLLARMAIPERFWALPPVTFSGGEQQRVNIARGLIAGHPVLLVDEPTASLDSVNRQTVLALLQEARDAGAAIVAICHDDVTRAALATRYYKIPLRVQAT